MGSKQSRSQPVEINDAWYPPPNAPIDLPTSPSRLSMPIQSNSGDPNFQTTPLDISRAYSLSINNLIGSDRESSLNTNTDANNSAEITTAEDRSQNSAALEQARRADNLDNERLASSLDSGRLSWFRNIISTPASVGSRNIDTNFSTSSSSDIEGVDALTLINHNSTYFEDLESLLASIQQHLPSLSLYLHQQQALSSVAEPENEHKCPSCGLKMVESLFDEHISNCDSKPSIVYNEDTLYEEQGECDICLEEMLTENLIARLPCLCIYHKNCIDKWFTINRTCPKHPDL